MADGIWFLGKFPDLPPPPPPPPFPPHLIIQF